MDIADHPDADCSLLVGGGRGVYCSRDVEPESSVMILPLKHLITVDVAKNGCSVGRLMQTEEERGMSLIEMNDEIICGDCGDGGVDNLLTNAGDDGQDEIEQSEVSDGFPQSGKLGADKVDDPILIEEGDEACEVWGLDVSSPPHCYLAVFILEDR